MMNNGLKKEIAGLEDSIRSLRHRVIALEMNMDTARADIAQLIKDRKGIVRPLTETEMGQMRLRVFKSQLDYYRNCPERAQQVLNSVCVKEIQTYLEQRRVDDENR